MVILEQPTEPLTPTDASYDNRGCTSRKGCPHPSACRGRASPKLVLRSVRHELHLSIGSDASSARVGEAPSGRPCLSVGCSGRLVPRAGSRTVRVLRTIERRAQRAFFGVRGCEQFPTGLSVYDIDHERGTVRITRGKGDKERIIPIGERALAWITKYLDAVRPHLVVADSGDALFLTQVGDPFTPHGLLEVYRATHPAARIGVTSEHRKAREEAFDRAEAADLLTAVDDEDDEEAPVVNEALST